MLTRPPSVVVSLKAYLGAAQTRAWLADVREAAAEVPGVELTVLPSFPLVPEACAILGGTEVAWGAQDVAPDDGGAQTGEVTAALLAELGSSLVVVGHAERRSRFGDTDAVVRSKVAALVRVGITPLVCVGETARTDPQTAAAQVVEQLTRSVAGTGVRDLLVGYEPVWAIGAPSAAPAAHVVVVADALRAHLRSAGIDGRVLYGGAAGPGTLTDLWPHVDGVFLGRFAHHISDLAAVLEEARVLPRTAAPRSSLQPQGGDMVTTIGSVAVIGAGYMGGGIAQSLALAGLPVTIADASAEATKAAYTRLLAEAQEFEDAGLYDAGAVEAITANLRTAASIEEAVADVDFIEEAVFEKVEVKHDVLARISAAARPDAIIGSNTSTIPARILSQAVTNPSRFLTVHFSNPAPFIPGVELVLGSETDEAVVPVVKELLSKADRKAALVADVPGFVLNRLQYVLLKEATAIVEEGIATPEDVDLLVKTTFGFRLGFFGPFAIADQAGLDVYAGGFKTFEENFGERLATPKLISEAVTEGRHGVKNGKGLLRDYTPDEAKAVVAYRNKAYSEMGRLVRTLGNPPA